MSFAVDLKSAYSLSFSEFQTLDDSRKVSLIKEYQNFLVKDAESEIYDKEMRVKLFLPEIISTAYAAKFQRCLFGGWTSQRKWGVCDRPNRSTDENFERELYQKALTAYKEKTNLDCKPLDNLLCNPAIFGKYLCLPIKSKADRKGLTTTCHQKAPMSSEQIVKELESDKLLQEIFEDTGLHIEEKCRVFGKKEGTDTPLGECLSVKNKIEEIRALKSVGDGKAPVPKIKEKEVKKNPPPVVADPLVEVVKKSEMIITKPEKVTPKTENSECKDQATETENTDLKTLCIDILAEEKVKHTGTIKTQGRMGGSMGTFYEKGYNYIESSNLWNDRRLAEYLRRCEHKRVDIVERQHMNCHDSYPNSDNFRSPWTSCPPKEGTKICNGLYAISKKLSRYLLDRNARALQKDCNKDLDYRQRWDFVKVFNKIKDQVEDPKCELPAILPKEFEEDINKELSRIELKVKTEYRKMKEIISGTNIFVGSVYLREGLSFGAPNRIIIDTDPEISLKYGMENFSQKTRAKAGDDFSDLKHHFYVGTDQGGKCRIYRGRDKKMMSSSLDMGIEVGAISIAIADNHRETKNGALMSASCARELNSLVIDLKKKHPSIRELKSNESEDSDFSGCPVKGNNPIQSIEIPLNERVKLFGP